jgi:hypothetical protein
MWSITSKYFVHFFSFCTSVGQSYIAVVNNVSHKERTKDLLNTSREIQTQIKLDQTTPDFRNTPSTTNLEGEDIVDALGKEGNASMPEQVKRPNSWK